LRGGIDVVFLLAHSGIVDTLLIVANIAALVFANTLGNRLYG